MSTLIFKDWLNAFGPAVEVPCEHSRARILWDRLRRRRHGPTHRTWPNARFDLSSDMVKIILLDEAPPRPPAEIPTETESHL